MTMEDAEALRRECSVLKHVAPSVDCWGQVAYGNRNWRPGRILGATPDYLAVRNWPVAEGEPFTMDDVRGAAAVCLIGQTIVEKLFGSEPALGKEIRVRGVGLKVVGILARKGANVMGQDQDDFVLAPLTTIKFRVTGQRQGNQPAATVVSAAPGGTRSQVYPSKQAAALPAAVGQPGGEHAPTDPLHRPRRRLGRRRLAGEHPGRHPPDRRPCSATATRSRRARPDDFKIRDHTEIAQDVRRDEPGDDEPAARRGAHLARRRRRGHHEHHAGVRDRADAGDRHPHGRRRAAPATSCASS